MTIKKHLNSKEIIDFTDEEWNRVRNDYILNYDIEKKAHVEFHEIMRNIFKERNITSGKIFTEITGMDREYYSKFRNKYIPKMKTLVTLCIALDIEVNIVQWLLHSIGLGFKKHNKVHYAYYYLLSNYRGSDIEDCNMILKHLGIDEKDYL